MALRDDFPILAKEYGSTVIRLIYLDNAATTQKPQVVIDAMNEYYTSIELQMFTEQFIPLLGEATEGYEACRTRQLEGHGSTQNEQ